MKFLGLATLLVCSGLVIYPAKAESVFVKYRGPVDLGTFQCEWISGSSFVERLCYDSRERYALINLKGTYYHYCEIPRDVVLGLRAASSKGGYYNAVIKGHYDCRVLHVPEYKTK